VVQFHTPQPILGLINLKGTFMKKIFIALMLAVLVCVGVNPAFAQEAATAVASLTGIGFIDSIATWVINNPGAVALVMLCSDRVAKLTPTEWDNKTLKVIFGLFYKGFAIIGAKVPDIEKASEYLGKK
jgi:hypothetical protein